MPSIQGIKAVFGGGSIGSGAFADQKSVEELLTILQKHDIKNIDTARRYVEGKSEELLGAIGAGKRFVIDTKHPGGASPGTATEERVVKDGKISLAALKLDKVDVFYMHAPDPSVPLASTLAGINTLYQNGAFCRFGLSNYSPEDVEAVYNHCKEHNYPLPTVYQGNYNAVARKSEYLLLPILRKLGIAFYAYSPSAGGYLTKTKEQVLEGHGRFSLSTPVGMLYSILYAEKPTIMAALTEWEQIANEEGVAKGELAYRWVAFNSALDPAHGDAVVFSGSSMQQVEETAQWLKKGSLSEKACAAIDRIWKKVEHEAPEDIGSAFLETMKRMQALQAQKSGVIGEK